MDDIVYSIHAKEMIIERDINEKWIMDTILNPSFIEKVSESEIHYIKQIKEHNNRVLRVVVNSQSQPYKIITLFFDRRIQI